MGSVGQNSTFSEYGHGAHQIKGYHDCSNMVANILLADPPTHTHTTLGIGLIGQNLTFSDFHVAYQIKWNHEMQHHGSKYLPSDPPTPLTRSIGQSQLFQNMVMLHIKLKGIMDAATWYHIFCSQTPPHPR